MGENNNENQSFDPFHVFEVDHKTCHKITVTVLRGRNIIEAANNIADVPDPYVKVSLSSTLSPNVKFSANAEVQDDTDTPEWNHKFHFFIDMQKTNILNFALYDEDVGPDKVIGVKDFDVSSLEIGTLTAETFLLESSQPDQTEIDVELLLEEDHNPDLRFGLCLCDEEKEFLANRQEHSFEAMKQMFGDKAPKFIKDVPGIAAVYSGGGFRGMVATCGVMTALHNSGIMDFVTYMAGLSGSTWYLSHLYAHPDWPERSPGDLANDLKEEVTQSFTARLFRPEIVYQNFKAMSKKKESGQFISFTDFSGYVLGTILQPNRLEAKFSDHADLLKTGKVPMPLLTAATVMDSIPGDKFNEWVECSAFEIGFAKYGIAMKTQHFGSKFFLGRVIKEYPEQPMHFLQGIWGSVWSLTLDEIVKEAKKNGICGCGKNEGEEVEPVNEQAERALMAQKIRADLEKTKQEVIAEEELITLNAKDVKEDSDKDDDESPPDWYLDLHQKAEQNALNRKRQRDPAAAKPAKNQVSPEAEKGSEEAEPIIFVDETFKRLNEEGPLMGSRLGRIAKVFNYMNGLELQKAYPVSPFTQFSSSRNTKNPYAYTEVAMDPQEELVAVADAGLNFRIPFPPILRAQRNVDIMIVTEYSLRQKDFDAVSMFQQLKAAEAWARSQKVPFPRIDVSVTETEGIKEVYVFEEPNDPLCPVILFFPLVNLSFKDFKEPGVPRETEEEKEFGDFNVYEDGEYFTLNMTYDELDFDRLKDLMEYNVLNNVQVIKDAIARRIKLKQKQHRYKMKVFEKAVNNMTKEDVLLEGLRKTFQEDSNQDTKAMVDQFMAKLKEINES